MKRDLTAKLVEKPPLPPASNDRVIYWDKSLSRLGLMVTNKGHKSWIVQYRLGGRSRRMTLDGVLSLKEARDRAHDILSQVAKGDDPAAAKSKARQQRSTHSARSQRAICASEQRTFDRPLCIVERLNASSCLNSATSR